MSGMDTQSVLIGEILFDGESIPLRVEAVAPASPARIALLKYKLSFLLDTRFKAAPPPETNEMTLEEVLKRWKCHRAAVSRRIKAGELRPIERDGDLRFSREEVERLSAPE
jgi:hypothetical protein